MAALGTYFYYITVLTASLLRHTEYNTASIPLLLIHVFCAILVRETPIPTPYADERLILITLKPYKEVNNGRVITSTRNAFEAGRDDPRVSKAARDTSDDGERLGPEQALADDC
jgi:hypothetical protein